VLRSHILNKQSYKKIALIDPVAISPWGSSLFKHIKKYQKAFAGVPDYIHTAIVEAYVQTASHHKLDQETLNGILKPWSGDQGKSAFYRQIAQADVAFTNEFQNKFSEIESKVLILWGEEDQWIPCEQAYLLQRKIKHSKLVTIPGSGHLIIEEKPVDLALEIMSFFES